MASQNVVEAVAELGSKCYRERETLRAEADRLRAALLDCARMAEGLKHDCGMDPESAQAVRNMQYMAISVRAHVALGTIRGSWPGPNV
jgi:hypothetical protein